MVRNMTASPQLVQPLGSFLDCVQGESNGLMEKFGVPNGTCLGDPGTADAWGLPHIPMGVFFSTINYLGLLIVVAFVLVLLIELLVGSQARGFGQGRYISFTYTVQNSWPFKIMAGLVVVFSILIVLDTARFLIRIAVTGAVGRVKNFVCYVFLSLLSLAYSSITLLRGATIKDPFFDYTAEEFKELLFMRSWSSVFDNNEVFTQKIGVLLLQYQYGDTKPLRAACATTHELPEVVEALTPLSTAGKFALID